MGALKHHLKECDKCIYAPCGKAQNEDAARYCFVRFLIWEADEYARTGKDPLKAAQENPSSYIKRSNKPTEEPERPTAEWEEVTEFPVKIEGELPEFSPVKIASMRCSACRQYQVKLYFYGNSEDNSLYCGCCGAKMKGVKTDA